MQQTWFGTTRRLATVVVALGAFLALGGCFHVSQRALANGRTLTYNGTSETLVYGRHDLQTQRQTYSRADSYRARYRPVPFPYFGHW